MNNRHRAMESPMKRTGRIAVGSMLFAVVVLCAAGGHGGWIPISAGVYDGVRVTGAPGIKDDLVNAGAIWEDAAVVVDRHFVSSRKPDDLPDFCRGILEVLTSGGQ